MLRTPLFRFAPVWSPPDDLGGGTSSPPSASPASSSSEGGATPSGSSDAAAGTGGGSSPPPAPASEEPFDFGSIFDAPPSAPEVAAAPTPTDPPAPQAPAPAEPPAQRSQEVPAAPQGNQPQSQQPQAAPTEQPGQAPLLDPADPISLARGLAENKAAAIEHVAKTMFQLTPEDVEALETNAVDLIPRLLARAVVESQQQLFTVLSRSVPMMIQRHQEVTKRHSDNEKKFYGRWPDLSPEKHGELLTKYGRVYRQMHPDAPLEKMIEDLGPMVMMAAGVRPGSAPPATPAGNGNGSRPPAQAFVPAAPGTVGHGQPVEAAPFDFMGQHG